MLSDLIETGETQLVNVISAKLNLKANETAALLGVVKSVVVFAEVEAANRGLSAGLAALAKNHPQIAAAIESIPEVKALLPVA